MNKDLRLHIGGPKLFMHLGRNLIIGLILIIIALLIGMIGYHFLENISWLDAFLNACMILGGMGEISPLVTTYGKLFAGIYALFSGLAFIVLIAIILSPMAHQFIRKIHLVDSEDSRRR